MTLPATENTRQYATLFTQENPLVLDSGRAIGPVTVAYETYGRLNRARDNVIFVAHALTGDSHVARHYPGDKPGWWDDGVGPGLALDTERYCVVCANVLGGCQGSTGPMSPNPATGRPYGLDFPLLTPRDMVRVEAALLSHLGVEQLRAVIGGSLGAMRAMEWAVTFPERVRGAIPVAGASRFHPQGIAFNEVQRQAILQDPHFHGGQYYGTGRSPERGLATARMLGMITYRSDESMWHQFGREVRGGGSDLDKGFGICYQVESYLHHQGDALVRRFDANSYLYLSKAMDLCDISRGHQSLAAAYARVRARTLLVGIRSDLLFPPYLQQEQFEGLQAAGARAEYIEMDSPWGHDAFLVDFPIIAGPIARFLGELEG